MTQCIPAKTFLMLRNESTRNSNCSLNLLPHTYNQFISHVNVLNYQYLGPTAGLFGIGLLSNYFVTRTMTFFMNSSQWLFLYFTKSDTYVRLFCNSTICSSELARKIWKASAKIVIPGVFVSKCRTQRCRRRRRRWRLTLCSKYQIYRTAWNRPQKCHIRWWRCKNAIYGGDDAKMPYTVVTMQKCHIRWWRCKNAIYGAIYDTKMPYTIQKCHIRWCQCGGDDVRDEMWCILGSLDGEIQFTPTNIYF